MGSKRVTKASAVLTEAKVRLDRARESLRLGRALVLRDEAVLQALEESYAALEKSLAVKPRGGNGGPKLSPTTASGAGRRSSRPRTTAAASSPLPTEGLGEPAGIASSEGDDSKEVAQ